jgi:DeoR family transcriptional regulator, catabolite repression regulator
MAIGDRQLKILQVIQAGHTTGEAIVDALGSSMQMLSHYMNQMVEDGYIKAARLYDNELRDFVVVRAYLTSEGEAILAQTGSAQAVSAQTVTPAAMVSPANPVSAVPAIDRTAAASTTDYSLVSDSLATIATQLAELPSDWREIAEVYLDDLQTEINIAYRRRPIRIRAYFLAMLRMLLPIVPKMPNGDAFLQQVRVLSGALAIPVKLPGDPS